MAIALTGPSGEFPGDRLETLWFSWPGEASIGCSGIQGEMAQHGTNKKNQWQFNSFQNRMHVFFVEGTYMAMHVTREAQVE